MRLILGLVLLAAAAFIVMGLVQGWISFSQEDVGEDRTRYGVQVDKRGMQEGLEEIRARVRRLIQEFGGEADAADSGIVEGTVTRMEEGEFRLTVTPGDGGEEMVLLLTEQARVETDDGPVSPDAVTEGDRVVVGFLREGGTRRAVVVYVVPGD